MQRFIRSLLTQEASSKAAAPVDREIATSHVDETNAEMEEVRFIRMDGCPYHADCTHFHSH